MEADGTNSPSRNSSSSGNGLVMVPQTAPGAQAAIGHIVENSIPLSIFPIATDKFCFCFCGLPGRGKTKIANKLKRFVIERSVVLLSFIINILILICTF
jgi:hypothetical protein